MSTKIIVVVRTRDESARIGQFCKSYKNADMILVGDGGSVDNTKKIAARYSNVVIRDFLGRTVLKNGYWRNNDSDHANWMFAWAKEYDPDWIIYDDCDCRPNFLLKKNYRKILEETSSDYVMVTRFYLWGLDKHFPYLCKPGTGHVNFEPSLWAFRGNQDFWTINVPPAYDFRIGDKKVNDLHMDAKALDLFPPYALLHFSWDNAERVDKKIKIYQDSGFIPGMRHPLDFGGPLEDLPEYLHE